MSIRFNGNAANFLARTSGLLDYNSPYTVMAWVKLINDRNDISTFFNLGNQSAVNLDITQTTSDGTTLTTSGCNAGCDTPVTGSNLAVDTWVHLAQVRESASSLKLYVNAVLNITSTRNVTGRSAQTDFEIGRTHVNTFTGEPVDAEMAHLRVWSTNLTPTEIAAERASTTVVKTASIYGVYPLATGATAGDDISGQSRPFTVNGTITTGASSPPIANISANAGYDQTRLELETVMLDSSASTAAVGIASRLWEQVSGTAVTLTNPTSVTPTFPAPDVASPTDLVFKVTITDNNSDTAEDQVTVTIQPTGSTAWLSHAPQEQGLDPDEFHLSMESLPEPSMVIRNGRVIGFKGDITQEGLVWSASKSLVALIFARQLFLNNVDYTDTVPGSDNPTSPQATYHHFLSMTSDYALDPHSPGNHYAYNNLAVHHYGTHLKDTFYAGNTHVQMLQNAFATALHFEDTITYNTSGLMSGWDGGWSVSCRDLARPAQLVLQEGVWEGSQIIDADFCDQLYTNQIPDAATENPDYGDIQSNEAPFSSMLRGAYASGFWLSHNTDLHTVPSVNEAVMMSGAFGTTVYISRLKNLIVLACNVGGTTTNNESVFIPGNVFDLFANAIPEQRASSRLRRGSLHGFFDDEELNRTEFIEPPASNVTVGLTGNTATGAIGTLGFTKSGTVSLTGVQATGSVGSLTFSGEIVSKSLHRARNFLFFDDEEINRTEFWLAAAGSPDVTVGLTGVSSTVSVGSLSSSRIAVLAGNTLTSALGVLGPDRALALDGIQLTAAVGTPSVSRSSVLVGISVATETGTLTPVIDVTVALTGVSVTTSVGTLESSRASVLESVSGTSAAGTVVVDSSIATSGITATAAVGSLVISNSVFLTGVGAVAAVGTISVASDDALAVSKNVGSAVLFTTHVGTGVLQTSDVGTMTLTTSNVGATSIVYQDVRTDV